MTIIGMIKWQIRKVNTGAFCTDVANYSETAIVVAKLLEGK